MLYFCRRRGRLHLLYVVIWIAGSLGFGIPVLGGFIAVLNLLDPAVRILFYVVPTRLSGSLVTWVAQIISMYRYWFGPRQGDRVNFQDPLTTLFDVFPKPPTTLTLILVAFFLLRTIASILIFRLRRRLFSGNGALIGVATRFGSWAITIGVIGLLLLAVRYAGIPYIDMRFLLYLTGLAAIAFVGFIAFYLRRRYPAQLAAVRAHEVRRHYSPRRNKRRRR